MSRPAQTWIALLRAVNVGGTGRLPMAELKAMCARAGFAGARTYIASGNVVFAAALPREKVRAALEAQLRAYAGKPVGVVLRTPDELAAVLADSPFPGAAGNRTVVVFVEHDVAADCLATLRHRHGEQVVPRRREIHVHYGDGMAQSKLQIPAGRDGTGRNMNTIAALLALAQAG